MKEKLKELKVEWYEYVIVIAGVAAVLGLIAFLIKDYSYYHNLDNNYESEMKEATKQLVSLKESNKSNKAAGKDPISVSVGGTKVATHQNYLLKGDVSDEFDPLFEEAANFFEDDSYNKSEGWYVAKYTVPKVKWYFCSNIVFWSDSLPVIWLCQTEDGKDVVAYATATYDKEKDKFVDLKYGMTTKGLKWNMAQMVGGITNEK